MTSIIVQILLFHVVDEEDASDAPVMAALYEINYNETNQGG